MNKYKHFSIYIFFLISDSSESSELSLSSVPLNPTELLVESGATSEVRRSCVTGSDIYTSEDNQEWSDISVVRGQRGPQQRPLLPPQGETRQLRAPRGQAGQ